MIPLIKDEGILITPLQILLVLHYMIQICLEQLLPPKRKFIIFQKLSFVCLKNILIGAEIVKTHLQT